MAWFDRMCLRVLPWVLVGCAFECEDDRAQQVLKPTIDSRGAADEAAEKMIPAPAGPPVPWQALQRFAPDAIGAYRAQGPVQGETMPAPGTSGTVGAVKRVYEKDGTRYELHILDAMYAPQVRQIVKNIQGSDRSVEGTVLRGTTLKGYPAIEHHSEKAAMARAGVLVGGRYVINVSALPANSHHVAMEFAEALDLDALGALKPDAGGIAVPREPAEPTPGQPAH